MPIAACQPNQEMNKELIIEVGGLCQVEVTREEDGSASVTASGPVQYEGRSNYMVFLGVKDGGNSLASVAIAAKAVGDRWYADFVINSRLLGSSEVLVSYSSGYGSSRLTDVDSCTVIE